MLAKLFKHEFIDLFKKTILFFSVVIGLSLLVFLFGELGETMPFFGVIKSLMFVGYIFAVIGIILYSVFYPIVRYYKSMLSDEGYLTHTLPVNTNLLLFTKLVTAFLLFISTIIIALLSLLLTKVISLESLEIVIELINPSKFISYLYIFLYLVVYYFAAIMMFITSMTVGYSSSTKKASNSIVVGVIIYVIQQVIGMIGLGVMIVFNPNIFDDIVNGNASAFIFFLMSTVIYLLLVTAEIVVTRYFLKNKLNLE